MFVQFTFRKETLIPKQFELLLESLNKNKNYYFLRNKNINFLESSHVEKRYLNLLEIHGCSQEIVEPTRVTHDSESLIDRKITTNDLWNFELSRRI